MRMAPDLVRAEHHNANYGGKGAVTTILWPDGTASAVSQSCSELIVSLLLTRLALEEAA